MVEARLLADDWGDLKERLSRCCVEIGRKRREGGRTDYHPPVRATRLGEISTSTPSPPPLSPRGPSQIFISDLLICGGQWLHWV